MFLVFLKNNIHSILLICAVVFFNATVFRKTHSARLVLWYLVGIRLLCFFDFRYIVTIGNDAQGILNIKQPVFLSDIVTESLTNKFAESEYAYGSRYTILTILVVLVWILGVGIMLSRFISKLLIIRKTVSKAVYEDGLLRSELVDTAFVWGLTKPKIVIPYSVDQQDLRYIRIHENQHISHKDHLLKPLAYVLLSLYWFNPFVWVAYSLFVRDLEFACDERVAARLRKDEVAEYAQTILRFAADTNGFEYFNQMAPAFLGKKEYYKKRINTVLKYKKPGFARVLLIMLICILLIIPMSIKLVPRQTYSYDAFTSVYAVHGKNASILDPYIIIDSKNNSFMFSASLAESNTPIGYYYIDGSVLKAVDNNSNRTFCFLISEVGSLRYDASQSTERANRSVGVYDGMILILKDGPDMF